MLTDNSAAPLILIVEDDINHAELILRSFDDAAEEYRLEVVSTITAARMATEKQSPGLIITDYRLPDGDGSELVSLAAGSWPVILMTSHGSEQVAVEAMKIGAQDYIVKSPENFANLPGTVKYALISWALLVARREVSEAAVKAKKDWELTFDAVPDLISLIDTTHTITRANRAMAFRCDLTPEEMIGKKCYDVVHGPECNKADCFCTVAMQDGLIHNSEIKVAKLDGVFDATASPLFDEKGRITGCVHFMRDITERKRAEEERQNLERQFQHTQKLESLGVLSGGIAHDFNNILTIILGHCYILKAHDNSEAERDTYIGMIESAANRAADLCRQMLTYSGKNPLLQTEFNLWMMVDEIVKMLSSAIKKNVNIKVDMKRDLPMIIGDSSQIQQVIMNLIINASEAIGDNNGTITVALKKTTIKPDQPEMDYFGSMILSGDYACLEVSDSGCGMSEETKERIFEPFYTTKFTGRGLGMSALLGIIKAHNGTLQLASTLDVGTIFKVYLPLTFVQEHVETSLPKDVVELSLSKATVLFVDDEDALLKMGSTLLDAINYSTVTASNGREAVDLYRVRGSEIDLVMLDLIMPEMGGVEAYHELRKIDAFVPIIICSGYDVESVADVIEADERAGFLHKPYKPAELSRVLNKMIGG
ncbi:MAG: response regulator [Geobacteraceae bacterium]|nr:response regulator [Geobacteraceae bacterium]NTW78995.1 response regulator [Geobacteraceae bacterium]